MEVGGELQASSALRAGKVQTGVGWIPQPVWTFLRRNISFYDSGLRDVTLRYKELRSNVQPSSPRMGRS